MSEMDAYDYELPRELIAQEPLRNRVDARLMIVDRASQTIDHAHIRDLPQFIAPQDCLIMNNTRVIPARLVGRRDKTGARWSGLFLAADVNGNWQILSKTRGKLEPGELIIVLSWDIQSSLALRLISKQEGGVWVVRPEPMGDAYAHLEKVGRVPLPPYIRDGEMVESDVANYQTVFADKRGAVAAPTAGLHFTPDLLKKLTAQGVAQGMVTLHVGIGTFRPVSAEKLDDHVMHKEWCEVDQATVDLCNSRRSRGGRVVAVGTTVVRTLESAARTGELLPMRGDTQLFIKPGFAFHAVDALITNFHLPKSTLLVLVRTFGGDELMKRAYKEAIRQQYRFFSYGDAMLIL